MDYLAWRITFQSDAQAAKAAFSDATQLRTELAAVKAENEALRGELLTPEVFTRLLNWLREDPPRNASAAFTAGIERQIAYALEMDVLPEVKSLRLKLAHTERSLELAKELAIERKKMIEELEASK